MIIGIFIFIFLLYLLSIMPKMKSEAKWPTTSYYAHRGLHEASKVPENSLLAIGLAVDKEYGVEFDVQLSKDKLPVVFHDYSLKRVCGLDKKVCDLTFDELRELKLFNSEEGIPHLVEVLDRVDGKVPLIVELKIQQYDMELCSVVANYLDKYTGFYCIESFNPLALLWFKKNRPRIVRGQLSTNLLKEEEGSRLKYFILQNLLLNFLTRPDFIAFDHRYSNMLSFTLCRKLYQTTAFAWTVKDEMDLHRSRDSFDYCIFEGFRPEGID